jgi:hypothetical protein
MTDFVDVLEQQLIAAHGRRQRLVPPWRAGMVLVAAAGAAAIIVVLVVGLSSPDSQRAATPGQQAPPQTAPVHPVPRTTVAVLNGTTLVGLARTAADKLSANGYRPILVTNDATNQTRRHSEVFYKDGYRADAYAVADCLGIPSERVHTMTVDVRVLADRADIAVFVGSDRSP